MTHLLAAAERAADAGADLAMEYFRVERVSGTVTDLEGDPWTSDSDGIVATNSEAHDAILDRLDGVDE